MKDSFMNYIEQAGQRLGIAKAFTDFLTITVCALSAQEKELLYMETIKPYNKEELNSLCSAFAQLVIDMDDRGEGLKDCLGDPYMDILGSDRKGQFFTPQCLCDMIAQLTPPEKFKAMNDPCCGSGRFFLAAAKVERDSLYYGADIDYQCCQMTLINMCLNGLYGVVSHMDTLRMEEWHRWEVKLHSKFLIPYIHEIDLTEDISIKEPNTENETEPIEKEIIHSNTNKHQYSDFFESIDSLL